MPKIIKVGGCIRDSILGITSKDIDFTYVSDNLNQTVEQGFQEMTDWMTTRNFEIFLSTPDCFTIRAKFPKDHVNTGMVADFVMARKETGYYEGTRRPILEIGSLEDDLVRRDFKCNALAIDEDGNLIDLFGGVEDIRNKILDTPVDPRITFMDDPLRILRCWRFSITKDFTIHPRLLASLYDNELMIKLDTVVSKERIREELYKMFKFDTIKTLQLFNSINMINPELYNIIFSKGLWLKPTFEL